MVRVSWGGEVVIADLAQVVGDGGNGGDSDPARTSAPTTSTSTTTPTASPAPTLSPPLRAPTATQELFSDIEDSQASSFSDDPKSLRDDLSSLGSRSPRREDLLREVLSPKSKKSSRGGEGGGDKSSSATTTSSSTPSKGVTKLNNNNNNNNNNGPSNGDITISSDEYRRFLTLKGESPKKEKVESLRKAKPTKTHTATKAEEDLLGSMDRMLATLSDLEDDLEPIDGIETESEPDEAEIRRELLTDKWRLLFDKFDLEGFGEIPWGEFRRALVHPEFVAAVDEHKREVLALKAQTPTTSAITFQDFVNVVSVHETSSLGSSLRLPQCIDCHAKYQSPVAVGLEPGPCIERSKPTCHKAQKVEGSSSASILNNDNNNNKSSIVNNDNNIENNGNDKDVNNVDKIDNNDSNDNNNYNITTFNKINKT
ncbi:uncharacterized protein LOC143018393 [Oratosquilla oratoria]|uniref:uncharacterized protein LOC143018393 n=1 Tax=Oratosquilla oratoria TaxID=337810 RepID=UPI003F76656F